MSTASILLTNKQKKDILKDSTARQMIEHDYVMRHGGGSVPAQAGQAKPHAQGVAYAQLVMGTVVAQGVPSMSGPQVEAVLDSRLGSVMQSMNNMEKRFAEVLQGVSQRPSMGDGRMERGLPTTARPLTAQEIAWNKIVCPVCNGRHYGKLWDRAQTFIDCFPIGMVQIECQ